jgi:hypothetical protein
MARVAEELQARGRFGGVSTLRRPFFVGRVWDLAQLGRVILASYRWPDGPRAAAAVQSSWKSPSTIYVFSLPKVLQPERSWF